MTRRAWPPFAAAVAAYGAAGVWLHGAALFSGGAAAVAGARAGAVFVWDFWWRSGGWLRHGAPGPDAATALFSPVGTALVPYAPLVSAAGTALARVTAPATAQALLHACAFATSGAAMWLLAWRLTRSAPAAFASGWVFMLSDYALTQQRLGHLGESFGAAVPLALWGAIELGEGRVRRGAALLGGGLVLAAATTPYVAAAAGVAVLAAAAVRRPAGRGAGAAAGGAVAAAVLTAAVLYAPLARLLPSLRGGSDPYALWPSSLASLPVWHPGAWGRAGLMPENGMGWLGLAALALAAVGARRSGAAGRPWLAVAVVGAVLALGPRLEALGLPLPYALAEWIPFLSALRTPARLMLVASAGVAALAALGAAASAPAGRRGWALALGAAAFHAAEVLPGWAERPEAVDGGALYRAVALDPAEGSLLELPVGVTAAGDVSVNAQAAMLRQTAHGRALTVGRPARHEASALRVVESTDLLFELTHPAVIARLYADPALAPRLAGLRRNGSAALAASGVRFALLRRDDPVFPEGLKRDTERLLRDTLGPPWRDEGGAALWKLP